MDLGWDLLEQGEYEGALEIAEALLEEEPGDLEALYLSGSCLLEAGSREDAEARLRRVLEAEPENLPARLTLSALLYESCRFDEALDNVQPVARQEPGNAYAQYLAGLLLEMKGRAKEAEAAFTRAAQLDPERYSIPESIDRVEFQRTVQQALEELPAEFRGKVTHLPIIVEDLPSADLLSALDDPAPDLLGLFVGTSLAEKSHQDLPGVPEAVYLFKKNLERACSGREELLEEIRVTLLHEIGHYLGMDETDLEEAGYD